MILLSPAKLNVFLEIIGKRPDGFHELETVMLRTQFCDTLRFAIRRDSEIRIHLSSDSGQTAGHDFPLDQRNLIYQAAQAVQCLTACSLGVDVVVTKRIPAQAGLAGGSSNAATTLRAVDALWQTGLAEDTLHQLAARLGSDVNFLLSGYRAGLCQGRGEVVHALPITGDWFFVACRPSVGNSTPAVFGQTRLPVAAVSSEEIRRAIQQGAADQLACFNRLTEAGILLNTEMADLLQHMQQLLHRPAYMSGSGSTCFVVARDLSDAQHAAQRLAARVSLPVWILQV